MIFNLFKSKPTLKELIPKGFVDIHSHILPGIDDGAKNTEESINLLNSMYELGFSKVICTPHTYPGLYDNTNDSIKNSFSNLIEKAKINLELDYASEYMIDESIFEKVEKNSILCIKEKYVLIEMSFLYEHPKIFDVIYKLRLNNYIPILAHPERYIYYENSFEKFVKLKKLDCRFQLNLLSLTGYYGNSSLRISEKLIKNNLIDFFGSDIHNLNQIKFMNNNLKIERGLVNVVEQIFNNNNIF